MKNILYTEQKDRQTRLMK